MPELTGRKRFAHLYRRAGFGASEAEINEAMALDPNEDTAYAMAVDRLVNYDTIPEVTDRLSTSPDDFGINILWWLERMLRTRRPLVEKMTFFWHDHFATSLVKDGIGTERILAQNSLFRANALGNFEQMLRDISRDPAMLVWLDLIYNRQSSPNENWAREVLELFALGVGTPGNANYSELDIREATRAFTGYTIGADGQFFLNVAEHDSGSKTVLGQSCNSGDSVLRLLMTYRKNGEFVLHNFICWKLFNYFAYPVNRDASELDDLTSVFLNRSSIRDVLQRLFLSTAFQSNQAYRALIKSPVEVAVGALRMLGAERVPFFWINYRLQEQGQLPFFPRNVSGWPSGRAWINAHTVLSRSNMCATIVNSLGQSSLLEAGGLSASQLLAGLNTGSQKVDRVLGLLVDNDVPLSTRQVLTTYANGELDRGLFNMVLALPQFQLS